MPKIETTANRILSPVLGPSAYKAQKRSGGRELQELANNFD